MRILVVDVGGSHIKVLATGQRTPLKISSGPDLTAAKMVCDVRAPRRIGRTTWCPVKVINDAAMQALGNYQGGRMLLLGLGRVSARSC